MRVILWKEHSRRRVWNQILAKGNSATDRNENFKFKNIYEDRTDLDVNIILKHGWQEWFKKIRLVFFSYNCVPGSFKIDRKKDCSAIFNTYVNFRSCSIKISFVDFSFEVVDVIFFIRDLS